MDSESANLSFNTSKTEKSSLEDKIVDKEMSAFTIVIGVVIGIVCIAGVFGNAIVLTVIKRKPSMRSPTNYLLANLATADLLSLLGVIPVVLQIYTGHPEGELGHYLCVFLTAGNLSIIPLITSVLTLAVLAYERYMALVKPLRSARLTLETVPYAMAFTWTVAIAFSMPYFVRTTRDHDTASCIQKWASPSEKFSFLVIFFVFLFIIPYSIIVYCYGAIIKGIYFSGTICPMNVGFAESDARSKRRIVEVLLIVTASFTICVGSFGVVNTLNEVGLVTKNGIILQVAGALLMINSSINPIIYAFRSSNYKSAFKEMLGLS